MARTDGPPPPAGRSPPADGPAWFNARVSLNVHVYTAGATGEQTYTDAPPGTSDAAGFENWRTQVWGSAHVRALGAELLPQLAAEDPSSEESGRHGASAQSSLSPRQAVASILR